jgi:hypothetical protein
MDIDLQLPLPIPNVALSYVAYDQYLLGGDDVHNDDAIPLGDLVMMNFMVLHSAPHMQLDNIGFLYFP